MQMRKIINIRIGIRCLGFNHWHRSIFIAKGDLPDYEDPPRDVRHFLRTRTYLVRKEMRFFEKFKYSLLKENVPFSEQIREFFKKISNCLRIRVIYDSDLLNEVLLRSDLSKAWFYWQVRECEQHFPSGKGEKEGADCRLQSICESTGGFTSSSKSARCIWRKITGTGSFL